MPRRSRRGPETDKRAQRPTIPTVKVRHLALPERAAAPIAGTALLLFVWAGVAHASGSGWVQAVGAVVAGLLLLGLVAPAFAAPGLSVVCVASPGDGAAGSPVEIDVVGNRSMRCVPRSVDGPPLLLCRRVPARLVVVPPRRGVFSTLTLRLGTAAPFGLLWWSRDQVLELPRPLHVAPKVREHKVVLRAAATQEEGNKSPRPALSGDLRGVRPYQHGDSRRRVHWRATAHTGDLMIRESEVRAHDPIRIVAHLDADLDTADKLAEEAMGEVLAQLKSGRAVVLETYEPNGRVVAYVTDRLSAGRRLARAVGAVAGG